MTRTFTACLIIFSLLVLFPPPGSCQGTIEEVRQYFELRDTISLMNLEMKRALTPDSQSPLLGDTDARARLDAFVHFIASRIENFAQLDTPLKYHYLKKLNVLFAETRQLHTVLAPRLRSTVGPVADSSGTSVAVTIVPAPRENVAKEQLQVQNKPYFDSIGMRTLAPAPAQTASGVAAPLPPRPDLVKTPVVIAPLPEIRNQTATAAGKIETRADMTPVVASQPVSAPEVGKEPVSAVASAPVKTVVKEKPAVATASSSLVQPQSVKTEPVKAVVKPVSVPERPVVAKTTEKPAPTVPEGSGVMRPLAVMIENHNQSRPQSGLDQADIVYEMPVEGGITRFMAIYTSLPGILGPVRSCREYFIDRALEIGALYVHCGGSPMGYAYISKTKVHSIDEIKYGQPFYRDKTRKAPHNLYSKGQSLYDFMSEKIPMRVATQPLLINYGKKDPLSDGEAVGSAKIRYHGNYGLEIKYENGAYQRYMNGVLHIDRESQLPLRASAVIIQVAAMKTVDAAGRQEISFIGSGLAWILENGRKTKATWYKATPESLTTYKDAEGVEYLFPREGQIWVQVVSPIHKLSFNGEDEKPASVVGQPETASKTENLGKQG